MAWGSTPGLSAERNGEFPTEKFENQGALIKVTVDLQRPNFANFFFFVPDIAKISI